MLDKHGLTGREAPPEVGHLVWEGVAGGGACLRAKFQEKGGIRQGVGQEMGASRVCSTDLQGSSEEEVLDALELTLTPCAGSWGTAPTSACP